MAIRQHIHRTAHAAERRFDTFKRRMAGRWADRRDLAVVPYRGYAGRERVRLHGRVLRDPGIEPAGDADTVWQNLKNTWRRLESDEVPGARVAVSFGERRVEMTTDEEGYFEAVFATPEHLEPHLFWHEGECHLLHPPPPDELPVKAVAQVLMPPPTARFGVISDIDDTVVETNATDMLKMLYTVLFSNARSRLPFTGVAAFYRALFQGGDDAPRNPIFYVSSSPWNFYDLLSEFLDLQGIPAGPLLLRDLGIDDTKLFESSHDEHKTLQIERVLTAFPDLPFLLIGDSGQRDPEIYSRIVEEFPTRIEAIYIRSVDPRDERRAAVEELAARARNAGSDLLLVDDTAAAAAHAADRGFISPDHVDAVRLEVAGEI